LGDRAQSGTPRENITGVAADAGIEIQGKYLQILQETTGALTRLGYLSAVDLKGKNRLAVRDAAEKLGVTVVGPMLDNFDEPNYRSAFSKFRDAHADALLVAYDNENFVYRELIVKLAAASAIPALYPDRIFVRSGGLISDGFEQPVLFREVAVFIDKILKGAKPGELPMEQPTKFELVLNLKTAKTLGLNLLPTSLPGPMR
jgi:putative tryptophan/tyrosine transport system substrate-binding protein